MPVVDKFQFFKVFNSQMTAKLAAQMNIGIGFYDNDANISSKSMAFVIDAIAYREIDEIPEEVTSGDDYVKKHKVKGCGIRINLKYRSFSGESSVSVSQLNAALEAGATSVEMDIEGPGLGEEGLAAIISGQFENGEVRSLDKFEETLQSVYSNLVTHIKENKDSIMEEDISIFAIGNDNNEYFKTQSILFGLNMIIDGKSYRQALELNSDKYEEDMIGFIYNHILVGRNETDVPSATEILKAKKWRYQN